jgi:glutamyl-tRNA synthetase
MIVTRFAPSPSGYLHVGGIRTAIFNWAYARKHGGEFILRIDDTDQERHVEDAIDKITEDFEWLGLDVDSRVRQSHMRDEHNEAIEKLLGDGLAYEDDGCVRLNVKKVAGERTKFTVDDMILGLVTRNIEDIKDFVIRRSDGSVLYNLATVVDDANMEITHVLRGQEHLANTFPQILIQKALYGVWATCLTTPRFAHIPFICAPNSKRKLSKREDVPVTLDIYRDQGYLSETMFNYLCHLGWALDDKTEKWTREEFLDNFDIAGICKNSAAFDPKKLYWLQGEYMKEKSVVDKLSMIKGRYPNLDDKTLLEVIRAAGDRLKLASEIGQYEHFFNDDKFHIDPKAAEKRLLKNSAYKHLESLQAHMKSNQWVPCDIEELNTYCEGKELKPAVLIHALRVATTGKLVGFGVFDGIQILGKERTLQRIDDCLKDCP